MKYPKIVYKLYDKLNLIKNFFNINQHYPVNNGMNNISCNPFFIIGSGRSGNTLLRAVLRSHSKIEIPPESFVLGGSKNLQKI